jgi:predicted protein tyrosine phosphatase
VRSPPEFVVLPEHEARDYEPSGREVCISIVNPNAAPASLSPRFLAVLRLTFTDIAGPSPYAWDTLFSDDDARAILAFTAAWSDVERIVLHCLAGQSRSPAVALALCELWSGDVTGLEGRYPLWNTWVRGTLVRCGRELIPDPRSPIPDP